MSNTYPVNVRLKNNVVDTINNVQINLNQSIKALRQKYLTSATRITTVGTINYPDHGFSVGDSVVLEGTAPFDGTYTIVSVTQNSFVITVANSGATSDSPNMIRTELHVNEYRGGNMYHTKYILTQTIAQLLASIPVGAAIQTTIVSGISFSQSLTNERASLVAVADGQIALFFTGKMVQINQKTYDTIVLTDMDRTLTTVTVTSANHGLKVGQWITVDGSNNALDGVYQVVSVADVDTFTYTTVTSGTITDATGTAILQDTAITMYEEGADNKGYIVNELYSTLSLLTQSVEWYSPIAAPQALSGAGAITLTEYLTNWTTTAANAATLANASIVGQRKKILMVVDGGDGTLTPVSLSGGTTITFNDAGDYVILQWNGSAWVIIENSGTTVA